VADAWIVVLATLVLACGGSSATATDESGTSAGPAGEAPTPGQAAAPDAAAVGAFNGSACDLLTTAEVEAASGQSDVAARPSDTGTFDGESQCTFVSGGLLPVAIVTVAGPDTSTDLNGYLALPESVRLPVNGADAAFVPAAGFMTFVIKHGRVVAYVITGPAEGRDFQEVATALVQPVADRMP
jgi:hypothetical protein